MIRKATAGMHNMSNKFYNYLSDKLIKFFNTNEIRYGDKFFIQFDEHDRVDEFYNALKEDLQNVVAFEYQHENSDSLYKTFASVLENDVKVIVVNSNEVSLDYLVTLRNQVTTQEGVWENSALLLICYDTIDSIYDGMRNLEKEDMPFNINTIKDNLKDEIDSSKTLSKVDKAVSKFYLDKKVEDAFQTTLWDYEDILSIINKGEIEEGDYKNLGLFPDSTLDTYKTTKQKENRLQENAENFEYVTLSDQYENKQDRLEQRYSSTGVNLLMKDNWKSVDFKKIKDSREKFLTITKTLHYEENLDKFTNEGCIYWEKSQKETPAGRRKRHIIIFNENNMVREVSLKFNFDANLERTFLDNASRDYCSISKNSLKAKFGLEYNKPTFKKIKYNHNNQAKSTYEFNIVVLPCKEDILNPVKDKFQVNHKVNKIVVIDDNTEEIYFGSGENMQSISVKNDDYIELSDEDGIKIDSDSEVDENGTLNFNLVYDDLSIPIQIKEDTTKARPVKSITIWKNKRENQADFKYNGKKVIQETLSYHLYPEFKEYLSLERQMIQHSILYGKRKANGLVEKIDLALSDDLQTALDKIIDYYKNYGDIILPSLAYLDNDLMILYEDFIGIFNSEIEEIEENSILSNDKTKLNLLKIGTIIENDKILFSPISPLNIAYQLEVAKQCKNEKLDTNILNRLSPENLLPYLYGGLDKNGRDILYKPVYQNDAHEWLIFEKSDEVSISSTNAFIANVVKDKMNQFVSHFKYLFDQDAKAPIKLNIININEDKELVRGIFNFVRDRLPDRKFKNIIPVEINLYNKNKRSKFDEFFECLNPDQLNEKFGISISSRTMDSMDVLRTIQDNITYYKHDSPKDDIEYAHISFYKVDYDSTIADDRMDQIETGLSLDGLLSSITSINSRLEYRTGFGTKNILNHDNLLVETVINLNELSRNYEKNGENSYKKGITIITKPMELEKDLTEKLYEKSRWVTFIEPSFGLEYFNKEENQNLIIIHYSDQYSSSTKYDTITVTNKSNQYKSVIRKFLSEKIADDETEIKDDLITDQKLDEIIKLFNSINGEWLLKIISTYGHSDREKISIISAIKYCHAILYNKDIIWIPISMEEILRIAGTVKLSKKEGIFNPRILDGKFSDDLLFIGINPKDDVEVYYYPIEVKIGINNDNVVDKAHKQIKKTYELLNEQLFSNLENAQFRNKFYRNFFMQIALTNEQKLKLNGLFDDDEIEKIESLKSRFLNDDYKISGDLKSYIGRGAIVSFKQDNPFRSVHMEEGDYIIELTEDDAYYGLLKSFEDINEEIQKDKTDIKAEELLSHININSDAHYIDEEPESEDEQDILSTDHDGDYGPDSKEDSDGTPIDDEPVTGGEPSSTGTISGLTTNPPDIDGGETAIEATSSTLSNLANVRALIGSAEGSKHQIFWEYGHPGLANRHLLIEGKSGQGKTYFIQRLIMELHKQDIPIIIIDYTDGFKNSQLEDEFKEALGDDLKQHLVVKDKFPLNPFRKYEKEIDDDIFIEEDNVDVASRFRSIIESVYPMGIQQLNCVYKAVLTGLEKYGDTMNLNDFEEELKIQGTTQAFSALSQLQFFIDKNPFDSDSDFDWSYLNYPHRSVNIIQLTTYTREIQNIITEMILWDIWYYKLSAGTENNPFAVVLDEAQNLDFSNSSPCAKILQEGRKFGWSGWFTTQFLKGKMSQDAIGMLQNAAEKIYFNPPETSVDTIAKTLTKDNGEKKKWETKLSNLKKGQCIVYGPRIENGKFLSPTPVVVDVAPLSKEK